jgi:hypothetical protein
MRNSVHYHGYEISPRPYHLKTGGWTTDVDVSRDHGNQINLVRLSARNTWESKEDAIRQCLKFGARAIDGEVPGCELETL